jgi:hypothetical protein
MKKNLLSLSAAVIMAVGLESCLSIGIVGETTHSIPRGSLYTQVTMPAHDLEVASDPTAKALKVGKSTCTNILRLVATGDCGTDAAMRSAGITRVQSVDFEFMQILGIISKKTTVVRGE